VQITRDFPRGVGYDAGMARDSIELTFDPTTLTLARADATDRGVSLSRWMDEAARMRLRAEGAAANQQCRGSS